MWLKWKKPESSLVQPTLPYSSLKLLLGSPLGLSKETKEGKFLKNSFFGNRR